MYLSHAGLTKIHMEATWHSQGQRILDGLRFEKIGEEWYWTSKGLRDGSIRVQLCRWRKTM